MCSDYRLERLWGRRNIIHFYYSLYEVSNYLWWHMHNQMCTFNQQTRWYLNYNHKEFLGCLKMAFQTIILWNHYAPSCCAINITDYFSKIQVVNIQLWSKKKVKQSQVFISLKWQWNTVKNDVYYSNIRNNYL